VKVILFLREDYLHYLLEIERTLELPIGDNDILAKQIRWIGKFYAQGSDNACQKSDGSLCI